MKPLIGISGSYVWEREGLWAGYKKAYANMDYPWAVEKAGAIPVVLPITQNKETIEEIADRMDALLLSGGHDVNPLLYGQEPKQKLTMILPERDSFDYMLIEAFFKRKKPILGICRGLQIINVYFGGTLFQDIDYRKEETLKHTQDAFPFDVTHRVKVIENTFLAEAFKGEDTVNSYHHQMADKVADGFKIAALSTDGVVEAIEYEGDQIIYATQFHPEMLHAKYPHHQNVFNVFVNKVIENNRK